jgi:hypothetical protein
MTSTLTSVDRANDTPQQLIFGSAVLTHGPKTLGPRSVALTPLKIFFDSGRALPRMSKARQVLPPQFASQERCTTMILVPTPEHLQGMRETKSMLQRLTPPPMALYSLRSERLCPARQVVQTNGTAASANTRAI